MHEDLQQLARELRKETCPQRVVDEVARRISAQTRSPNRLRYGIAAALAAAVALCAIALLRSPSGSGSQRASEVARKEALLREKHHGGQAIERAQVARQVEGTFAYIGRVMVDAGAHSQRVILNDAVPPLRNSFEAAKDKIMNRIDL